MFAGRSIAALLLLFVLALTGAAEAAVIVVDGLDEARDFRPDVETVFYVQAEGAESSPPVFEGEFGRRSAREHTAHVDGAAIATVPVVPASSRLHILNRVLRI